MTRTCQDLEPGLRCLLAVLEPLLPAGCVCESLIEVRVVEAAPTPIRRARTRRCRQCHQLVTAQAADPLCLSCERQPSLFEGLGGAA